VLGRGVEKPRDLAATRPTDRLWLPARHRLRTLSRCPTHRLGGQKCAASACIGPPFWDRTARVRPCAVTATALHQHVQELQRHCGRLGKCSPTARGTTTRIRESASSASNTARNSSRPAIVTMLSCGTLGAGGIERVATTLHIAGETRRYDDNVRYCATNLSVRLHALHPSAVAAFRQRPSAAGFLLRRYRSTRPLQTGLNAL
jgi:hypothetical protein